MKFDKLVENILSTQGHNSITKDIKTLLDQGIKVYSSALGRVGEIIKADGDSFLIKSPKGKVGLTDFINGDKVKLQKNSTGEYIVTNIS